MFFCATVFMTEDEFYLIKKGNKDSQRGHLGIALTIVHSSCGTHGIKAQKSQNHRLEKTSKIIKSNHPPNTTMPAKPCPQVPHLHVL